MKIKAWGTRGSIAVSNDKTVNVGGNTTCFEIKSKCLPAGAKLIVDAGTGFVPAGQSYIGEFFSGNDLNYHILFTHYHWDHILGLTLSPPTFINQIPMTLYGPVDNHTDTQIMVQYLFERPFFPVDSGKFAHKMNHVTLDDFDVKLIIVHPLSGFKIMDLESFNSIESQVTIQGETRDIGECMIITMTPANHGNSTCISYRFEEKPTGKVFVLLTDHEDTAGISMDMRNHLRDADLLIIDGQYDESKYHGKGGFSTAGFGHGTAFGAVKHGLVGGVKKIGITHHDPSSTDIHLSQVIYNEAIDSIDTILGNLKEKYNISDTSLLPSDIFLCKDYDEYEI